MIHPLLVAAVLAGAGIVAADDRTPCADRTSLRRPFFGDLHVHTAYSFDAWAQGTRNTPRDAYRFARGDAIGIQPYREDGTPVRTVRLRRPLDFAMVSDHAEMFGETELCRTPGSPAYDRFVCVLMRRWPRLGYIIVNSQWGVSGTHRPDVCGSNGARCLEAARTPWADIQAAAEEHYDRSAACRFTTFVGYEWSGTRAGMVHRNVVFRNDVVPPLPADAITDANDERRLWERLERECLHAGTGCDALAIPHNANWSMGDMFWTVAPDGSPLSRETAARRRTLEPLLEITQHKGDSECRDDGLDPLCDFETPPYGDLAGHASELFRSPPPAGIYAREALLAGLRTWTRLGVNPFHVGFIGSTDTHLGTSGLVDEDAFVGHAAGIVTARAAVPLLPDHPDFNPGGLAVLWAEENSRDALFDAMRRREAYGTSGPRMVVRFFGGWTLAPDLCGRTELAALGYAGGVPMGADLPPPPADASGPRFVVQAFRDAGTADSPGAPLQRIQIVKAWIDGDQAHEQVVDVAGGPNDADVDLDTCAPRGSGFDELCSVWTDPAFDPSRPAVYYARVVENPTCRWSWRACRDAGVRCDGWLGPRGALAACCDDDVPRTIQERAWTSPIWYVPAEHAGGAAGPS